MSAGRHCYSPDAPQTERLAAYLEEKEARVERREAFARRHAGDTVVQLALNIPGRIKDSALLRRLLASGMSEFALWFPQFTECALTNASAGPSALFAAAEAPQSVKEGTAELEALHPWSRLFDFDVYDAGGMTVSLASRHGMGRTCFVCSRPAALCMREKSHSAEEVAQSVTDRLARFAAYETAFTVSAAARRAGALALRAALYEVGLQPKPGLVDPAHSGSHEDMDFFTFQRSAAAISSFFPRFFAAGELIADDPAFLLAVLRLIGLEAEEAMYEATGQVNTHKGLIFSLGLVLGAAGEVSAAERGAFDAPGEKTFIENILDKTAELGRLTLADFTGRPSEETPGMRAHRDYGLTGIRGEAAAGFPSIQTPLLALCSLPEADLDARRLLEALFEIMRELDDTTLVRRGGIEALQSVKRCARDLLESGALCQASWRDALHTVDREFVARRLSPGGAADCLSVMLFLIWLAREQ